MRISYIADSIIPSRTANSLHVMKMCEALARQDAHVQLIVPTCGCELSDDPFQFYGVAKSFELNTVAFKRGFAKALRTAFMMIKKAQENKPDIIYLRSFYASFWAAALQLPFVCEIHYYPTCFQERVLFQYAVRARTLKYIVVITHALKKRCIASGIPDDKIKVLPDGIDIERFPAPHYFTQKPLSDITLGYVGHLYKGRGIDIILQLAKKMVQNKCIIIGGTDNDISYWKNEAHKQHITNVHFMGFIKNYELPKYFDTIDILLMPHQKTIAVARNKGNIAAYTSPLKMFEYMATGKPIIASDLAVLKEVLRDKENCILVPCDDIEQWFGAIEYLVTNPAIAKKIGQTARKEVEEKYQWKMRAHAILSQK